MSEFNFSRWNRERSLFDCSCLDRSFQRWSGYGYSRCLRIFAAVSGSSLATALVMGKMAYPEMKKYNYSSELASGCIASRRLIGIMITPSVAFIMIGILTEVSIGKLFIAGILPVYRRWSSMGQQYLSCVDSIRVWVQLQLNCPWSKKWDSWSYLASHTYIRTCCRRHLWRYFYCYRGRRYRRIRSIGSATGAPPAISCFICEFFEKYGKKRSDADAFINRRVYF